MKSNTMFRWIVLPGVLAGFMLHAYICFLVPDHGPDAFTAGLFTLSILPYLACLVAGMRNTCGTLMAACATPPLVFLNILVFHEAAVAPTTSTSSLLLLVVPAINFVVLLLGFLVGWIVFKLICRNSAKEAL